MTLPKKRFYKKVIKKITVVWLLFFYLVPWNGVMALTETTHSFPTDTSFNAEGYSDDSGKVVVTGTEIKLNKQTDWWDEDFLYKRPLIVRNIGSTSTIDSGTPIEVDLDLITIGLGTTKIQTDLDDLRVVYSVGATHTEIARSYNLAIGNTDLATISFTIQAGIGIGQTDANYSLYYGNTEATTPSGSGYSMQREGEDVNATMVCPFDGTTTCKTGQTPSAESGAIRYSAESGSAIQFDGFNDYIQLPNTDSSLHITGDITLEAWVNIPSGGGGGVFGSSSCWDWQQLYVNNSSVSYRNYEGGSYWTMNTSYSFTVGEWYHLAVVGDISDHEVRLYINGVQVESKERSESEWPTSTSNDLVIVGNTCLGNTHFFRGLMDEVRISNSVRYTENFTPETKPLVVDGNTRLLLHFDENGDDPRMTGKVIDVSGNGNHGTNNGAKYVGGLVGIDPLASSGQVLMQSTASHRGVFVEESTTNLVSNPSFEHSTYSTGWSKPYVNLGDGTTAFTPNVSKRNSAGPFGQGIMLTNSLVGGTSPGDSNITMSGSTQVATSFYDIRDENQGTMVFWITPEWDGDDNLVHYIFGRGTDFGLLKDSDNYLHLYDYGDQELFDISDWQAGETYNVVIRWSLNKKIGNSNYNFLVDVNGVSKYVSESSFVVGGFLNRFNPSNSIIEGMTMYRRPLWDGSYGIDVGNGDEIEQIYNNGSGKDPTRITGSWDVVFALPTDSASGILNVGGTGQAWTHPYTSNKLYTSTTNTGGFMMGVGYTADGWFNVGTPSTVGTSLASTEKIFSGGYKWTSDDYNEGIGYTLTGLTAGQNYVVRALANSGDGVGQPKIFIYDNTNGSDITSFVGTTASTRTDPDVMLFTFELPTVARNGVGADCTSLTVKLVNASNSGIVHFHQIEMLENRIDNPSFDGGWSGVDPNIPVGWSNNGLDSGEGIGETGVVSSGVYSFKLVSDNWGEGINFNTGLGLSAGEFAAFGGQVYESSGTVEMMANNYYRLQDGTEGALIDTNGVSWKNYASVVRHDGSGYEGLKLRNGTGAGSSVGYFDDIYAYELKPLNLVITPASLANSTEASGIRVDGADVLTQTVSGLLTSNGMIKFKFTPRHNFDIGSSFGVANPVIMQAYGDSNNYIKLHKSNSTTLQLIGMFGGTQVSVGWTNPTLNAGSSYPMVVSYQSGGNLSLRVNNVEVGVTSGVVNFSTLPTTLYWGTDNGGGGSNPYDGTFRGMSAMSVEENTSSRYNKFGSKSVKFTAGTDNDQYTIDVGVSATNTLSAYVYDVTTGNVGGTLSSSVAELYFNNVAIGTTYMDTGGGWWRLMGQVTGVGTTLKAGVEVKAGKTVYVDGVQLERKTYSTSFADGSLGVGYSWGGTANASVSSRASDFIRYAGAIGSTDSSGTISFWVKPDWDSVLNRPAGQYKYIQYIRVGSGGFGWGNGFVISSYTDNVASSLNNIQVTNYGSGSDNVSLVVPMTRNNWHHVVYSWGNNQSYLYVDGGAYKDINNVFNNHTDDGDVEINSYGNANSMISDLRYYNDSLTESEVRNLYNSSLTSHTNGTEEVDRYEGSGIYTSSVVDLGNNGAWGSFAFQATESLGEGTSIAYSTRTSADNSTWGDWINVGVGGSIGSMPLKYFQWKAELSSSTDQSQTPEISGMVVSYVGDASVPSNPSAQASGFSAGVGTTSIGSGGNNWYNYETPYFSWSAGEDTADEGQSASGIDGYHVLFSQDVGSTPADNTSDDCYAWVDDSDGVSGGSVRLGYGELSNCTLSDDVYYLLIQTKDNSGNVASPSQLFTYQFDSSNPSAPTVVTSTTVGYKSTNEFGFIWPAAVDQGPAGIAGYEYKTGSTDEGDPFSSWQYTSDTGATNVVAYTEGQNFFYVRSVDRAGNKSATTTNLGVSPFYFNESAPTEPRNVTIAPVTSSSLPAASNVFTVSWDKPETYSGDIAKNAYWAKCVPSADNMTETTAAETVNRSLSNLALATQQGKNTFYIVAEDNNVNTETGVGNRNFEAYASVDFWASTTAPGAPTGLAVTDASDRSLSKWRLTLTWIEPVSGSEVDVYYIYRSIDNSNFSKIGEVSSTAYTDTDLVQSKLYYYKVYAVDNAKSLSLASSTVSLAPEGKYSDPPVAGGAPSVVTGSSTATLTWTTSRSAYGTVEYGKTTSYGQAASETATVTSHSIKLTGLTSGTTYHYRVQNLDDSSMVGYSRSAAYSGDYSFTTLSAAEISDVEIKDTGLDFAIISWKTRTTSSSEVVYGKTMDYGESVVVSTSTDETEHTVRLEDLEHSNTYHFKIKGTTVDGDDIESQDITFSTVTFPKLTSYVIKTDQSTGGTTIAAAWSTNVKTSSVLEYQRAEIVGDYSIDELEQMSQTELARVPIKIVGDVEEVAKNDLSFDHVIRAGSLKDGSIYILRIKGRDVYGNELVSDAVRYVTGKDTRAPVISNVSVETQLSGSGIDSKAQILVSWETDEEASSQVIYGHGTGSEYQMSTSEDKSKKTRHIVVIRDLEPNSSYHLKAVSSDSMGNTIYSQDIIAVTPSTSESALDIVLIQLEEIFGFLNF